MRRSLARRVASVSRTYFCQRKSRGLERKQTMTVYLALSRLDSRTKSQILRILILLVSSYPCGFAAR